MLRHCTGLCTCYCESEGWIAGISACVGNLASNFWQEQMQNLVQQRKLAKQQWHQLAEARCIHCHCPAGVEQRSVGSIYIALSDNNTSAAAHYRESKSMGAADSISGSYQCTGLCTCCCKTKHQGANTTAYAGNLVQVLAAASTEASAVTQSRTAKAAPNDSQYCCLLSYFPTECQWAVSSDRLFLTLHQQHQIRQLQGQPIAMMKVTLASYNAKPCANCSDMICVLQA